MKILSQNELQLIHDGSMEILKDIGVMINDDEAVALFNKHGVKSDGNIVFPSEAQILKALDTAPTAFTIHARNPQQNVTIGNGDIVIAPGYGAPFIVTEQGEYRAPVLEDYNTFCKLIQTSKYIDINGFMMIEPSDVPAKKAHIDMLHANIVLSDKAFMGSPVSRDGAQDAINMAGIVFGGKDKLKNKPVMISLINSLSPLKYSPEMCGALIEFAKYGQPCIIAPLIMAGTSGPIKISGLLAQQNAEILAAILLSQIVNPGTPVVYGSASSVTDMKTGSLAIGAVETSLIISATAGIAEYYGLPCRAGGSLTNAHFPDMQAGVESAFTLITAARSGVDFILHSCGILSSYLAMSFEKFVIDEEMCGMVKKLLSDFDVTKDSINVESVKEIGIGGNFLYLPETFELCKTEFFPSRLMYRDSFAKWEETGRTRVDQRAAQYIRERISDYRKPYIDEGVEQELDEYRNRKRGAKIED